jgi:hypothetical protein
MASFGLKGLKTMRELCFIIVLIRPVEGGRQDELLHTSIYIVYFIPH